MIEAEEHGRDAHIVARRVPHVPVGLPNQRAQVIRSGSGTGVWPTMM